MLWLAAFVLLAIGLFMGFLRRNVTLGSAWMRVTTVDREGREIHSEWVRHKPPDRYPTNGTAEIRDYIEGLVASDARFSSLSAFTFDGMRGFGLRKQEGQIVIGLNFRPERLEAERAAKAFFAARGIEPETDYAAGDDGTRVLAWPLDADAEKIDAMCRSVFADLCAVAPKEGLDITYEEDRR